MSTEISNDLIRKEVHHILHGYGEIIKVDNRLVFVEFYKTGELRAFILPDAVDNGHLTIAQPPSSKGMIIWSQDPDDTHLADFLPVD